MTHDITTEQQTTLNLNEKLPTQNQIEHKEFKNLIETRLLCLLKNEPLLNDLNPNTSIIELKNLLSLEHGESMTIFIKRADDKIINVIVKQNATLKDLKESIQNFFKLESKTNKSSVSSSSSFTNIPKAINWKYIWRNYSLMMNNEEKLLNNHKQLRDYGIKNRTELKFFKNTFRKLK